MHIPDGFLDAKTAAVTGVLAAAGLGIALRHAGRTLPPKRVPLMGLAAAFVFAAQMINFPVAAGTSGHLVGGVLVAVLLGPSAAVIVISAVLIVQCFMFADGGITALGANIFNMGLIGGGIGWLIYHAVTRLFSGLFGRVMAAAFAGWWSTVLASIACAAELAASHTVSWNAAFHAMAGVHALIGIGEGLITALVLVAMARTRPELLGEPDDARSSRPYGVVAVYGLLIGLGVAVFASPFASKSPDGLDKTAEELGFEHRAAVNLPAPLPDYSFDWIPAGKAGTSIAGAIGTLAVFGMSWVLAKVLVPRPTEQAGAAPPAEQG